MNLREHLKDKKRIVIKVGSSSLLHEETHAINLTKLEILVREISDLRSMGKDVILVSSGAIAAGYQTMKIAKRSERMEEKQACAAIGQAKLMMIYQKLFMEYDQTAAQILLTKDTMLDHLSRHNTLNTFKELLAMGIIPIVNENDTIATYEINFGDNDTLSAIVAALVEADLLILLSDIDGLYTDDPHQNENAQFIDVVTRLEDFMDMGKETTSSSIGTGGMMSKLAAAKLTNAAGIDMVIANGNDFHVIHKIVEGRKYGTLFVSDPKKEFYLIDYLEEME